MFQARPCPWADCVGFIYIFVYFLCFRPGHVLGQIVLVLFTYLYIFCFRPDHVPGCKVIYLYICLLLPGFLVVLVWLFIYLIYICLLCVLGPAMSFGSLVVLVWIYICLLCFRPGHVPGQPERCQSPEW